MKLQKLNKALKKLVAKTVTPKPGQTKRAKAQPAQAAKKASSSKTKKGPVVTKKAAPKKPAAPAKKAAAPVKPNHAAAKAAPAKALTPKAQPKVEAKPAAKDAKKKVVAAAPSKAPAPVKQASAKAPAATEDKSKKKAAAPVEETHDEVEAMDESPKKADKAAAPAKSAKARKEDEAPVAATATEEEEEVVLTDAEGRRYCRVKDCDQAAAVDSYCRYHYLLFWKNIQNRKKILSEGKLERYIEELTARYPDKYLELLRKDLRSEKDFTAAIQELEIDDTGVDSEYEDEAQSFIDEVRGMGSSENNEREEDF